MLTLSCITFVIVQDEARDLLKPQDPEFASYIYEVIGAGLGDGRFYREQYLKKKAAQKAAGATAPTTTTTATA